MIRILENLGRGLQGAVHYYTQENLAWRFMTLIVIFMFLKPLYFMLTPVLFSFQRVASPATDIYIFNNLLLLFHIFCSFVALALGPWMFNNRLRAARPDIHRLIGKLYIVGCMGGAISVFPLALSNAAGTVAHIGFGAMSIIWFILAYLAYTAAIHRDFIAHRRWAARSFAVTFAFVHVGLTYKLMFAKGTFTPQGIQAMQSMVSWLGNLLFAEIYLLLTRQNGQFKRFSFIDIKLFDKRDRAYLRLPKP